MTPELLDGAYGGLERELAALDDADLLRPSRCAGWTVVDVTFHLLLDAQRALVAFATPADGEPDVDEVSYWEPFRPGSAGADEHGRFVRVSTAAHSRPRVVVNRWADAARAVRAAAATTPADRVVPTQGHRLTAAAFLSTLVVEAVVHHLDLAVDLPTPVGPDAGAVTHTAGILDRIAGAPVGRDVDAADYILRATGRVGLDDDWRHRLGAAADRFPLLG